MNEHSENLRTVPQYFYQTCEAFASRPAQRFNPELYRNDGNGRFTYDEMRERVEAIAGGLLSLGLERQELVGLMSAEPYWTQVDMAISNCRCGERDHLPTISPGEVCTILSDPGAAPAHRFRGKSRDIRPVPAKATDLEKSWC